MRRKHLPVSILILLLCVGFLVSSCNSSDDSDESAARVSWTYMVYMAADNNLSAYARDDINYEIEIEGSSDDVNVVVQAEFNSTTSGVPSGTIRGKVVQDADTGSLGSWYSQIGNKDMTDPATLTEFIAWTAQQYPADHYALVLWSHAAGWKASSEDGAPGKGIFMDNSSPWGSSHLMSLPDLAEGIRNSGVALDVINLDACLMGMYEVAYELKETATYLVASPEEYPVAGDPYDMIIKELTDNPDMDAAQLALTITTKCREFYQNADTTMTKSAYLLSGMDQLHMDICALAEYLIDNMDAAEVDIIEDARYSSVAYLYPENHDLGDFLDWLKLGTGDPGLESMIEDVKDSMSGVIYSNELYISSSDSSNPVMDSQGMAIYLPSRIQYLISQSDLTRYGNLSCNDSSEDTWYDFLSLFVQQVP